MPLREAMKPRRRKALDEAEAAAVPEYYPSGAAQ